jgi:hypothetical protein
MHASTIDKAVVCPKLAVPVRAARATIKHSIVLYDIEKHEAASREQSQEAKFRRPSAARSALVSRACARFFAKMQCGPPLSRGAFSYRFMSTYFMVASSELLHCYSDSDDSPLYYSLYSTYIQPHEIYSIASCCCAGAGAGALGSTAHCCHSTLPVPAAKSKKRERARAGRQPAAGRRPARQAQEEATSPATVLAYTIIFLLLSFALFYIVLKASILIIYVVYNIYSLYNIDIKS